MIKTIKMQNCVPFKNEEIADCKKVNFIFGSNGSGKSTICSMLKGKHDDRFFESSEVWDNSIHETVYVYNRDFRINNIRENIPGVFTLGQATIDQLKEIETLKEDFDYKRQYLESLISQYDENVNIIKPKRESSFEEDAWIHLYKETDSVLQRAFKGLRNNKSKFVNEVKKRINDKEKKGKVCKETDLLTRADTLFVSKPKKYKRLDYDISSNEESINRITKDSIWNIVIAGNDDIDIAGLINDLGNSSWVSQGRQYISIKSNLCPFCQQETITDSFREKLEDFFDRGYSQRIEKMKLLLNEYVTNVEEVFNIFNELRSNQELTDVGKVDINEYSKLISQYKELYTSNITLINEKILEPEKKIVLEDVSSVINDLKDTIDDANVLIDEQNLLVDKKEDQEVKLVDDIWATIIHNSERMIQSYKKDINKINRSINKLDCKKKKQEGIVKDLELEIEEKEQTITSVEPAIKSINNLLKAYGFINFYIAHSDSTENCYCIKRNDGTLVTDSLSEGEETFLTFLYFMQYVKGTTEPSKVAEKKIIVLDDPICSLDSTILYVVSSMVKSLSEDVLSGNSDVKQLFVFTHNVLFHKEASFSYRNQVKKDVNYWIIQKGDSTSSIIAYGCDNPISTSYELLWKELRDNKSLSCVALQNIMRRIIENYFRLLGKDRNETLLKPLKSEEDKIIGRSLFMWMNEGSHNIPDDLFNNAYSEDVAKYKRVFKMIFCKNGHEEHYNMMMSTPKSI